MTGKSSLTYVKVGFGWQRIHLQGYILYFCHICAYFEANTKNCSSNFSNKMTFNGFNSTFLIFYMFFVGMHYA